MLSLLVVCCQVICGTATKKQMTFMNRKVKQGLDKLNLDWSKQNILTVPTDLKMPDNP